MPCERLAHVASSGVREEEAVRAAARCAITSMIKSDHGRSRELALRDLEALEPNGQIEAVVWRFKLSDPLQTPDIHVQITGTVLRKNATRE